MNKWSDAVKRKARKKMKKIIMDEKERLKEVK